MSTELLITKHITKKWQRGELRALKYANFLSFVILVYHSITYYNTFTTCIIDYLVLYELSCFLQLMLLGQAFPPPPPRTPKHF